MKLFRGFLVSTVRVAIIIMLSFVSLINTVFAQSDTVPGGRFDWVRYYSGRDYSSTGISNKCAGIVHDSAGNTYYLGEFGVGAGIDSTTFLPFTPTGYGTNSNGTVIAKFSPSGDMLWHKAIYSNYGMHTCAWQIQMLGDTAIACLVQLSQPNGWGRYTYFLDTLLTEYDDFFVDNDTIYKYVISELFLLNLDGDLIRRHSMQTAFYDTVGSLIREYDGEVQTWPLGANHFCIDNDGNIILLRLAQDYVPGYGMVRDGLVTGLRFIIDGDKFFDYHIEGRPQGWQYQILKFSPNFDSLHYVKYFVEPKPDQTYSSINRLFFSSMTNDDDGNFYISGSANDATIDIYLTNDSVHIIRCKDMFYHGFLVKYHPDASVAYVKQLEFPDTARWPSDIFRGASLNYNDSCIAVPFGAGEDVGNVFIDGVPLHLPWGIGFLRFDMNDGHLLSHGKLTSSGYCDIPSGTSAMANNRIAVQTMYRGQLLDSNRVLAQTQTNYGEKGMGITMWDYSGSVLYHLDYNTLSPSSKPGPLVFHDSSLYACGMLMESATFGDHEVPYSGNSIAYLARFVDPAFMAPSEPSDTTGTNPPDTGDVRITVVGELGAFVAYPNPFRQRVHIECSETIKESWLSDLIGHREQVRLVPQGKSSTQSDNGRDNNSYTLDLTARTQATYLLTIITDSGKTHTIRLMKMSDLFSNE